MTPGGFAACCEGLLEQGVRVQFRASGSSMEPAIRDGDLVTVEPANGRRVRRGDIVLYRSSGRLFAHRVQGMSRDDSVLTCQGDHWRCLREIIRQGTVIGRVVAVGPSGEAPAARNGLLRCVAWLRAAVSWSLRRAGLT
jgi:signal peptidase I